MRQEEDRAVALLQKYGISKPPVPVEEIATGEGVVIVRRHFDGTESGFTLRDGVQIIIGINTRTHRRRQRFSIAHEIGHVILHPFNPLIVDHAVRVDWRDDVSSLGTDAQEIEANAFGAALLMPQAMVIDHVKSYAAKSHLLEAGLSRNELISELVREFDVSAEAMGFRLINLGILAG
jgi:Zn-dependent peptidase ImmA (M78 family)